MRYFQILIVALALLAAAQSSAEMTVVARAYEVALNDFEAPKFPNDLVAFKACSTCDKQSVRVSPKTTYVINQQATRFKDFVKSLAAARDRESKTVIVLHHLESDTISSLSIDL
jgi:hypothetical protein